MRLLCWQAQLERRKLTKKKFTQVYSLFPPLCDSLCTGEADLVPLTHQGLRLRPSGTVRVNLCKAGVLLNTGGHIYDAIEEEVNICIKVGCWIPAFFPLAPACSASHIMCHILWTVWYHLPVSLLQWYGNVIPASEPPHLIRACDLGGEASSKVGGAANPPGFSSISIYYSKQRVGLRASGAWKMAFSSGFAPPLFATVPITYEHNSRIPRHVPKCCPPNFPIETLFRDEYSTMLKDLIRLY